jgi:hypothetical protein
VRTEPLYGLSARRISSATFLLMKLAEAPLSSNRFAGELYILPSNSMVNVDGIAPGIVPRCACALRGGSKYTLTGNGQGGIVRLQPLLSGELNNTVPVGYSARTRACCSILWTTLSLGRHGTRMQADVSPGDFSFSTRYLFTKARSPLKGAFIHR